MEPLAFAAVAIAGIVGVAVGYFTRRPEAPPPSITYIGSPSVVSVEHVHEATTANPRGWFCECGKHKHIYVFAIGGTEKKRCQCGAVGVGKEWEE